MIDFFSSSKKRLFFFSNVDCQHIAITVCIRLERDCIIKPKHEFNYYHFPAWFEAAAFDVVN